MASFSAAVQPVRRRWTSVVSVSVLGRWVRAWLVVIIGSFYRPLCTAFRLSDLSKEILAHRALLPKFYKGSRQVFFRLLDALEIGPTNEDRSLIHALDLLRSLQNARKEHIPATVSLDFAGDLWQRTISVQHGKKLMFSRKLFELCVFTYLAAELKSGDLAVEGSEKYADYREQLLPWSECERMLDAYCTEVELPGTAQGLLLRLWLQLKAAAEDVDAGYPAQTQLVISEEGIPTLKRLPRKEQPQELATLEAAIAERIEPRTIIEALCNVAHWTEWPRHFGPLSGSDPKRKEAV